jgi:hypothetical protein
MIPAGRGTKKDFAGYKQQKFNRQTNKNGRMSYCTTPRVVRQKNVVMSPREPETKDCAGEGQKKFTLPTSVVKGYTDTQMTR